MTNPDLELDQEQMAALIASLLEGPTCEGVGLITYPDGTIPHDKD